MPFCVAYGCNNQSRNNPNVSFHDLPSEPNLRKQWVSAIGRTELPVTGKLCSEHFTPESYEDYLKRKHFPELFEGKRKSKRRLNSGAVPTIFPHKAHTQPRSSYMERKRRIEHKQVHL